MRKLKGLEERSTREFERRNNLTEKIIREGLFYLRKDKEDFSRNASIQVPYKKKVYADIKNNIEFINSIADAYNLKITLEDSEERYVKFSRCR